MKNEITTNGKVKMPCEFCQTTTTHEIDFKHYGFNTSVQKQNVAFLKTCLHCEWVKNLLTVMLKEDFEKLIVVK